MELFLGLAERESGELSPCCRCGTEVLVPFVVAIFEHIPNSVEKRAMSDLLPYCDDCLRLVATMFMAIAQNAEKLRENARQGGGPQLAPPPRGTTKH